MAKATTKRSVRSARHSAGGDALRRFDEGPARSTRPTVRTVQQDSVDVEARTLTAVVATGTSRVLEVYDDDLKAWIEVEERIDINGMDFSRVESGLQFLDNHNSWDRDANLGIVTEARVEEIEGVGPAVVVDIKMSSRDELASLVQDMADGIVGCISCQYRPIETTLELRDGQLPLLTIVKSELLEVSLVSVPADPNALVRSETSLKGRPMAKRTVTARTQQRNDAGTETTLDEAAVAEIVAEAIAEATPLIVEETLAAARAEDGGEAEMTDEEKAAAAKKKEEEDAAAAAAGDGTASRSALVRSLVAKALGRSVPKPGAPKAPDLTALRSVAAKYGVGAEFDDMSKLGASEGELRSFVLNATAARSGTGQTHDGRNTNQRSNDSQLIRWDDTARAQRSVERNTRR